MNKVLRIRMIIINDVSNYSISHQTKSECLVAKLTKNFKQIKCNILLLNSIRHTYYFQDIFI